MNIYILNYGFDKAKSSGGWFQSKAYYYRYDQKNKNKFAFWVTSILWSGHYSWLKIYLLAKTYSLRPSKIPLWQNVNDRLGLPENCVIKFI